MEDPHHSHPLLDHYLSRDLCVPGRMKEISSRSFFDPARRAGLGLGTGHLSVHAALISLCQALGCRSSHLPLPKGLHGSPQLPAHAAGLQEAEK